MPLMLAQKIIRLTRPPTCRLIRLLACLLAVKVDVVSGVVFLLFCLILVSKFTVLQQSYQRVGKVVEVHQQCLVTAILCWQQINPKDTMFIILPSSISIASLYGRETLLFTSIAACKVLSPSCISKIKNCKVNPLWLGAGAAMILVIAKLRLVSSQDGGLHSHLGLDLLVCSS